MDVPSRVGKDSPGPDCRTFSRRCREPFPRLPSWEGGTWKRSSLYDSRNAPAASACLPSAPTATEATSTAAPLVPWVPAATASGEPGDDIAAVPKDASTTAIGSVRDANVGDFLSLAWGITLPRPLRRRSSWTPRSNPPGFPRWRLPRNGPSQWRSKMPRVLLLRLPLPALRGIHIAASAVSPAAGFAPPPPPIASANARPQTHEVPS